MKVGRIVLGSLAGFVVGVILGLPLGGYYWKAGPTFPDVVEEYRYLRSVEHPTPEQYIRIKELRDMKYSTTSGRPQTVEEAADNRDGFDAVRLPR